MSDRVMLEDRRKKDYRRQSEVGRQTEEGLQKTVCLTDGRRITEDSVSDRVTG